MVGYQGVSVRCKSQRQSGAKGSISQTGLPMAPARWPSDVSTEITKSTDCKIAMVSPKSKSEGPRLTSSASPEYARIGWQGGPFCKARNATRSVAKIACHCASVLERLRSLLCAARPAQAIATRKNPSGSKSLQRARDPHADKGSMPEWFPALSRQAWAGWKAGNMPHSPELHPNDDKFPAIPKTAKESA